MIFHVLNRGNDQCTIFGNEDDYAAFLQLFGRTREAAPMRLWPIVCCPTIGTSERADQRRWRSLAQRGGRQRLEETVQLCAWPIPRPKNWVGLGHAVQTEGELDALRRSDRRGCPFGDEVWQQNTAKQLGLEFTLRSRGRARKKQ